jgi:recombination protein RecR
MLKYSSKLIANAVAEFSKLPGIGEKTALRLVVFLLKQEKEKVQHFGSAITTMREQIKFCRQCHNVADTEICTICANKQRDDSLLCIVENFRDVIAIENTEIYRGLYHVLGGIISPIDGVGPDQLNIESLIARVQSDNIKEVVMAISPTIEGDTTIFYLSKKLQPFGIKITTIARGVSFGGELEYTDELTLARSIATRTLYENDLMKPSTS